MTPEEMERAIEIVLNNQASFEVQLEKTIRQVEETNRQLGETNRQLAETNRQLGETNRHVQELSRRVDDTNKRLEILTDTQTEFIQVVTRHIEAQGEINKSIRNAVQKLSDTVERHISEGHNGKA
jgi:septal ring factor EnvC (AmiA/AmiB activator)